MNTYSLRDLNEQSRAIGRGVVLWGNKWNGTENLALEHLGDTEGDITIELNEEYSHLTLPELTGAAKHRSYVSGEDPVISLPIFYADPDVRAVVSPTGSASGGYQRRRPVTERTLAIVPEELLFDPATDSYASLTYDPAAAWQVGGNDLSPRQEELLSQAMWFWRGYFSKAGPIFRHEDGGKVVQTVSFQVMQADLPTTVIPDGHRLYTVGDPIGQGVNIHPES